MNEGKQFVGTWLEREDYADLQKLAKKQDRSIAAELRMAIRHRIQVHQPTRGKK